MEEYKHLKYKTRANTSPHGKPRVYFCCHEADFERYFEEQRDEILNVQTNAAIYYYDPAEGIPEGEEFFADLSQMQLFVIPVTPKFIYKENRARTVELKYAIEHHIPVLPIMQENGLENGFNDICGDMQLLNKHENDPTAIPYAEKLKKFLESVLVSDELAEKIRAAFDAYIFLSYRKKDRKYAQQIMRLIHENDFCRDIAIWYDEFLVPGESFNNAIEEAMEKSALFTLVVTPNLLKNNIYGKPNYIIEHEYPTAKDYDKAILPIEALPTDKKALKERFGDIPDVVSAEKSEEVSSELRTLLKDVALQENNDPQHLFFMGLAYLSGIDVEVNNDRALKLITRAAEADLPEAYKKLFSMYTHGEGVKRNYNTAIEWQKKYIVYLKKCADEAHSEEKLSNLFGELWNLGDFQYYDVRDIVSAKESYNEMLLYAEQMETCGYAEARRDTAVSCNKLGGICEEEEKLSEARRWYERSRELFEEIAKESRTIENHRDLSVSYNKLGDICEAEGKLSEARDWYERSRELFEEIAKESRTIESRCDLLTSYNKLGDICEAEGKLSEARRWYERSFVLGGAIAKESATEMSFIALAESCNKLGDICKAEEKLSEARRWYERELALFEEIAKESATIENRRDLSVLYNKLGDICVAGENLDEAKEWYERGLELREAIAKESKMRENRRDLSVSYDKLGDVCEMEENFGEAKEWYERGLELAEAIAKESGTIENRRDLSVSYNKLGDVCEMEENFGEAKEWYERGLELTEAIAKESEAKESRRDLSISYDRLGNNCRAEGKLSEAKEWYERELELTEAMAKESKAKERQCHLSILCDRLGDICKAEKTLNEAKEWYERGLEFRKAAAKESGTIESRRDLSVSYNKLGDICKAEGKLSEAKAWYERDLKLREAIAKENGTIESRRDLSVSYNKLGDICKAEGKLSEAKAWYEQDLELAEAIESRDNLAVSFYKLGSVETNLKKKKHYFEQTLEVSQRLFYTTGNVRYRILAMTAEKELEKLNN